MANPKPDEKRNFSVAVSMFLLQKKFPHPLAEMNTIIKTRRWVKLINVIWRVGIFGKSESKLKIGNLSKYEVVMSTNHIRTRIYLVNFIIIS